VQAATKAQGTRHRAKGKGARIQESEYSSQEMELKRVSFTSWLLATGFYEFALCLKPYA